MSEEDLTKLLVRVDVPDIKTQKCVVLSVKDTVWAAKQVVLDKLNQDLPNNMLNYGLYLLPSVPGKLGKYMDDGRCLGDYVLHGHVPRLEMRYKRRDYSIQVSLKGKDISKANSKANHRKFVECVVQGSVKKIEKMLDSGIDPNFITDDGNTPLGIACGRNSNIQVIMPLLSNGAHIDFRGKDGLTPLHRAALGGNSAAIKILLSYGASPNYRDVKGLTPLYHTTIMGDDTACCESLLRYRAELGIRDHGGWTELHQVAKYGHLDHAELLMKYGADLHAQNNAGNTPLHVAASHGQPQLAMMLMTRGSDRSRLNFASQLPAQVAILCGHHTLSVEISNFQPHQIEPIRDAPEYHPGARHFDRNLFDMEKTRSEVCPAVPPAEMLVDSLAQEWTDKDADSGREDMGGEVGRGGRGGGAELLWRKSAHGSSGSIPSMTTGFPQQPHHSIETADSESLSSYDRDSIHSTSTAGTPGANTPQTHHRRQPTFATQRERLYHAGPGRYVAVEDVEPQQTDDIPLRRGMEVEVVFIGKGGYWEGRAGGRVGWFPARAIQEVTDDGDSGVFSESSIKSTPLPPMASLPENRLLPPPPAMMTQADQWGPPRRDVDIAAAMTIPDAARVDPYSMPSSNTQQHVAPIQHYNMREVVVQRGAKGYGFAMRGVKATKAVKFTPTPQVPALQYIGNVEVGGSADLAGLKTGDFLLEINHHNVTYSTHDDVVSIIRQAGTSLHMKVITPLLDPSLRTSIQLQQQVEISDTTNTPDHQHATRRMDLQMNTDAQTMPHYPGSVSHETAQRETVIDDVPRQPLRRGEESPNLDRINQSGWDSSQDETTHAPGTPSRIQKFSYLHGAATLPLTHQPSPKQHNPATTPPHRSTETQAPSPRNEPGRLVSEGIAALKSSTLPPQNDYPIRPTSPGSSDSEEESEFTKAVKKGKANLTNSPAMRQRASTLPSKSAQRIQLVNHDQSNNSPVAGFRKQNTPPSSGNAPPAFRQPLAEAIMRKIDSIRIDQKEDNSSDDEESFTKTPPMRQKSYTGTKEKAAPPAPKPKPQFRRAHTMGPSSPAGNSLEDPASQLGTELSKSDVSDKSPLSEGEDAPDAGGMNWKSVLRPVKRTESGRASPGLPDHSSSRSISAHRNQSPGKLQVGSGERANDNQLQFGMESGYLPPPLPAMSNRLSAEYLDLPPPEDFLSLSGVETGETSTDDIILAPPPPPRAVDSEGSPSPPPPPPPDSSPPREPLDTTELLGVQFQVGKKRTLPSPADGANEVPSPIPSPVYPSSFDADMGAEPVHVLPPQEFVSSRQEMGNVGFEIPTPPGFEISTPPSVNVVPTESADNGNTEPDLNEAIRQLQQLSDTLTVTPSENLSGTSHSSKQALSPKRSETANRRDEQVTVAESPVYTPPIRSRSSTSSSNVSSLAREAEVDMSGALEIQKTRAHMTAAYREKLVAEWEVDEVCEWLEDIGLGEHCPQFRENEILGEHLLELTKEELAELGVKKIGHKKTFLTKVKELVPSS